MIYNYIISQSEIICDWYFEREEKDTKLIFKHAKRGKVLNTKQLKWTQK